MHCHTSIQSKRSIMDTYLTTLLIHSHSGAYYSIISFNCAAYNKNTATKQKYFNLITIFIIIITITVIIVIFNIITSVVFSQFFWLASARTFSKIFFPCLRISLAPSNFGSNSFTYPLYPHHHHQQFNITTVGFPMQAPVEQQSCLSAFPSIGFKSTQQLLALLYPVIIKHLSASTTHLKLLCPTTLNMQLILQRLNNTPAAVPSFDTKLHIILTSFFRYMQMLCRLALARFH